MSDDPCLDYVVVPKHKCLAVHVTSRSQKENFLGRYYRRRHRGSYSDRRFALVYFVVRAPLFKLDSCFPREKEGEGGGHCSPGVGPCHFSSREVFPSDKWTSYSWDAVLPFCIKSLRQGQDFFNKKNIEIKIYVTMKVIISIVL